MNDQNIVLIVFYSLGVFTGMVVVMLVIAIQDCDCSCKLCTCCPGERQYEDMA